MTEAFQYKKKRENGHSSTKTKIENVTTQSSLIKILRILDEKTKYKTKPVSFNIKIYISNIKVTRILKKIENG
jgi:hypothetical protein